MKKNQKLTKDDVWEMFAETNRQFKESAKQFKENAKQFKETDRKIAKMNAETDQRLDKLSKLVGGIGNSNGELAEEYFYNSFYRDRTFVNEHFDKIKKNMSYNDGEVEAEFDLVLFNGKSVALIEVKYNAKPDNIEIDRIISRVEVFKILFPNYKHHKIYLGVAAMSFHKSIVWQLHRAGIATIRPIGKKMVVYDKTVRAF